MRKRTISPATQIAVLLGLAGAAVAAVAAQEPEIRRYLKMRSM